MIRPAAVSTRNIRPGCSRPLATTSDGSTSSTPASLASTTRPSRVRHHRPGRRPLRSSTAPTTVPSVNATLAGPSHGLHQAGVEAVEVPPLRVHRLVVLPRLRDHHQHRVRQAAAAQVQQLEHLVEVGRVRRARRADREDAAQVARDQVAAQQRLAGGHPVPVAPDGVDLSIVGDVPVRVGQRPGRERVGREPRVHQRDRADHPLVGQVREERGHLVGRQHSLVDDGPAGQRREVQRRRPARGSPARSACARRT